MSMHNKLQHSEAENKHATFLSHGRQLEVPVFVLTSLYTTMHINIKFLFTRKDD